jgi:HEAT repeat protein
VIVGVGDLLREVSLKDGAVSTPGAEVVLTRVEDGPLADRILAFDVATRLLPPGTLEAANRFARDEKQPPGIRLRAVVALRRRGEDPNAEELFLKSIAKGEPDDLREYAARHLAEVLGERALPHLRDLMRGTADEAWHSAQQGFRSLGEKAVPTLLEMLAEKEESPDYRGGAAHALGEIQSGKAYEGLLKAVTDPAEYVANAAVNAAIATGGPELEARLTAILRDGSTQDLRIAFWLADRKYDGAPPAILAAIGRLAEGAKDRARFFDALKRCTGKDFGESAEAWKNGLGIEQAR